MFFLLYMCLVLVLVIVWAPFSKEPGLVVACRTAQTGMTFLGGVPCKGGLEVPFVVYPVQASGNPAFPSRDSGLFAVWSSETDVYTKKRENYVGFGLRVLKVGVGGIRSGPANLKALGLRQPGTLHVPAFRVGFSVSCLE